MDFPPGFHFNSWNWYKMISILENMKRATKTMNKVRGKKKKRKSIDSRAQFIWVQSQLYHSMVF